MSRWRERLGAWRRHVGGAGAAGLAAALAAAWLYGVAAADERDRLARLVEAERTPARAAATPDAGGARLGDRRAAFERHFPGADTLQDWIERIEAAGTAAGVAVERTDYRIAGTAAGLVRCHVVLPVKGTYAQLRALVATLLENVPALALANVDFKRDAIEASALEGRLEFVLFLKTRAP